MPCILCIDTSTEICSVALFKEEKLLSHQFSDKGYSHAENITVFISKALKEANLDLKDLTAVAVSKGPGSYTGLRIGVSTAKGICYALDKPLIAVDSLLSLAYGIKNKIPGKEKKCYIIPMIDARRMEVYCSVFDEKLSEIEHIQAHILDTNSFQEYFNENKCYIGGTGAEKFKALHENNNNIINIFSTNVATNMILPVLEKYNKKQFENVAYFEPYYLKDFIAGKPKKLL